jgi:hypothetical protein
VRIEAYRPSELRDGLTARVHEGLRFGEHDPRRAILAEPSLGLVALSADRDAPAVGERSTTMKPTLWRVSR